MFAEDPGLNRLIRNNSWLFVLAISVTFVLLRLTLSLSPDSDFNVAGYNIHHLFTGLVLISAGGIPLAIFPVQSHFMTAARITFGIGLGMALDEWVYLIATDGTNADYLLPASFWGGVVAIAAACLYAISLAIGWCPREKQADVESHKG